MSPMTATAVRGTESTEETTSMATASVSTGVSTSADPEAPALDDVVLEVVGGVLGFPGATRFALVRLDDEVDGLFRMVCVDQELAFVVAAPLLFFPDYAPEVDDAVVEQLDLGDDALALVVLTLTEPLADSTANLLAPLVLNPRTRRAVQVVLSDASLPLRRPLIGA
jgi:flagellar assembly factor FliW